MTIHRRAFLSGLVSLFGVANTIDLKSLIQDKGRPLLLPVRDPVQRIHVYEDGMLTVGPWLNSFNMPRPTWRQQFAEEGVAVDDPIALAQEIAARSLDPDELDQPICDICWPMAHDLTWAPSARAYRLLERLNIGANVRGRGKMGRLIFHEGDNHPGSNDLWVNAADDVSVSCLQARFVELNQPIEVVMECETVCAPDD
jgi:hypothetical protein